MPEFKLPRPFTLNDIHVGASLYAVLAQHAASRPGNTMYYGDVLAQARKRFPADPEVQRAVPIGIGMKLLFVEAFCVANGFPNLACLVVNKKDRVPGDSYPGDWEKEKIEVAAFDWSTAQPTLDAYVAQERKAAAPLVKRGEGAARDLLFAHFRAHRAQYAGFDHDDREEMVSLLMAGWETEAALRAVCDARAGGRWVL